MSINKGTLKILRRLLQRQVIPPLKKFLEKIQPADLSDIMIHLPPGEQKLLITMLHVSGKAGTVLTELPNSTLKEVLEGISDDLLVKIISQIQVDDGAILLDHISKSRFYLIFEKLPVKIGEKIEEILRFPSDTAGSLMNTYFLKFYEDLSVSDALQKIRTWSKNNLDPIYTIFCMDDTDHLIGSIPLRLLAIAGADEKLGNIMLADPICVNAYNKADMAAKLIVKYDLVSLPVVDNDFTIIGVIMVDDMIDTILENAAEEAYHMQGITEEDRLDTPVFKSIKSRFPWIIINLCTAFIAASVVGIFEHSIQKVVVLATFMPIVAGLGGNSGTQALAIMIRAMALGEANLENLKRAILRQIIISLLLGIAVGVITGLIAYAWRGNFYLGVVILVSMVINMTIAGLIGTGIPWVLKSVGQDPALGGGVLVTAVTDSLGFLSFLGISTIFISVL
jgi:magnesium transporter